jgi:hypothetical protein
MPLSPTEGPLSGDGGDLRSTTVVAQGINQGDFDKIDNNKDGFIARDESLQAAKGRFARKPPQPEK